MFLYLQFSNFTRPWPGRRHLAEYSHVEAECPFIDFNDLLNRLEDLVCDVVDRVLKSPYGHVVKELNPDFVPPKRPFRRMDYSEAIQWLKDNNVTKDDGTFYEFGEVIFFIFFLFLQIPLLCRNFF